MAANTVGAKILALHKNSIVLLRQDLFCRPRLVACSTTGFHVPGTSTAGHFKRDWKRGRASPLASTIVSPFPSKR
ncbi:hypothetical protein SAMCFNEI73_Ch3144 [Sinorhizobium americanum]|uniref:Uncharacterized protein n=1 Tax=Sinorhizobium americanum TaxID=194963 RepID=A0A1L3LQN1_9HYPH|nr:hypothetical protein SAMCFNEI73_Ch3144 [Sinorhizobium americanum]